MPKSSFASNLHSYPTCIPLTHISSGRSSSACTVCKVLPLR
ncbi:hypothetical protein ID866_10249 [Astraeus odoratus]|nr:hypothetical protein ID866_10249 [Astraeus odoratus]